MLEKEFYVISFDSTHHALKTEKLLKGRFPVEMIPTPREISASCGLSIKFSKAIFDPVMEMLKEDQGEYKVFRIEKSSNGRHVTKVS
ncbi:DUF3343 domain-containing protein [Thermotalea metallivorans]|uniref:Putative Se/S carrier protein-like domain-containing protein n=1 Tax=Thermotalea metallivorans TaxID=520762 RepID=A0A140L010_9FIRM|nr:DUF3343 domain-containing protein [Thermotalea metallivorans]KXG73885.1 hypothetical protein AN619_28050 [Thermotalea metallivorans]